MFQRCNWPTFDRNRATDTPVDAISREICFACKLRRSRTLLSHVPSSSLSISPSLFSRNIIIPENAICFFFLKLPPDFFLIAITRFLIETRYRGLESRIKKKRKERRERERERGKETRYSFFRYRIRYSISKFLLVVAPEFLTKRGDKNLTQEKYCIQAGTIHCFKVGHNPVGWPL